LPDAGRERTRERHDLVRRVSSYAAPGTRGILLKRSVERLAAGLLPFMLAATPSLSTAQAASAPIGACDGRLITSIEITAQAPTFVGLPSSLRTAARAIGFNAVTRPNVVRRFLLLDEGHPCTERQRAESERILRLQPFIADATVRAVSDGAEGVRIEVETIDEIPVVLGASVDGWSPSAVTLGSRNVAGGGIYLAARGERGGAYRDGASLRLMANQALGRPYTLALLAERAPLSSAFTIELGHAFLTELQRTAWHAGYGDLDRYVSYLRPHASALSMEVERSFWDVGGVTRIGLGGRRAYLGGLLTHERASQDAEAVVITDTGLVPDADQAFLGRFAPYENVRLNAVLGARFLTFTTVRGFDALTAAQDVATGVQIGVLAGRGLPNLAGVDEDVFLSGDIYAGRGSPASLLAMRLVGEGRRDLRGGAWDGIVASARVAWYRKSGTSNLFMASGEFAGGWHARLPFQLTLADRQGGVRGYHGSRVGGGQRAVIRLEERWPMGRLTRRADTGLAAFADAGATWAGAVPFGVSTPLKTSVGVSLLAAAPRSAQLWRLDLAVPLNRDSDAGRWEVRLSTNHVRGFWREPNDITRLRAAAAPSRIFTWP
jgi:hypothetical protein